MLIEFMTYFLYQRYTLRFALQGVSTISVKSYFDVGRTLGLNRDSAKLLCAHNHLKYTVLMQFWQIVDWNDLDLDLGGPKNFMRENQEQAWLYRLKILKVVVRAQNILWKFTETNIFGRILVYINAGRSDI